MWDHLDDVDPPVPGAPERSRVGSRAQQRRQRRVALVSGAAGALVLATVLGVLVSTTGSSEVPETIATNPPTSPTPTVAPSTTVRTPTSTPTGAPSSTGAPGTVGPTRMPTATRTPSGTPCAPTAAVPCADGRPGWVGDDACTVWNDPLGAAGIEVVPGLRVTLDAPDRVTSTSFTATLSFANTTEGTLEVRFAAYNLGLLLVTGGEFDADYGDSRTLSVAPGESASAQLQGSTRSCGDTPTQGRVSVPVGLHEVGARLKVTVDQVPETAGAGPSIPLIPTGSPSPAATPTRLGSDVEVIVGEAVEFRR